MIRKKVLAPDLSLDHVLERSPDRETSAKKAIEQLIQNGRVEISTSMSKEAFYSATMNEIFGYGPLQPFIDSDRVTEIMVNGPYVIFIERDGRIVETGYKFLV